MGDAVVSTQAIGQGQCVDLVKSFTGLGATSTWKAGDAVGTADLTPLKPIATFSNGVYPSNPTGNHAAILLDKADDGSLTVFDQYSGKLPGTRVIRPKGGTDANQALIQRGEQEATDAGLSPGDGRPYYRAKYKYYNPGNDADN
jgi:hypothetical protein